MKTLADAIEEMSNNPSRFVHFPSYRAAIISTALDWMEEKIHELEDPDALNLYLRRDLLNAIKEERDENAG